MDDYNVISSHFDVDEDLQYPVDEEELDGVENVRVVEPVESTLTAKSVLDVFGSRKRKISDIENVVDERGVETHPMDWHLRMDVSNSDVTNGQRQMNQAKRKALEEFERRINDAIADEEAREVDDDEFDTRPKNMADVCDAELTRRFCRRQEVMTTPPIDGSAWIGLSDQNQQRLYLRTFRTTNRESFLTTVTKSMEKSFVGYKSFKKVELEAQELRTKKTEETKKKREKELEDELNVEEESMDFSGPDDALWVSKYSAHTFCDLLSDDTVNRNLLTWLKMWDECVFKNKNLDQLMASLGEKERETFQFDSGKVRRPAFKMVLLSGPAGLGKTTMAGVIAKQAGYARVDVNASDSRTVADIQKVLEGAVKTSRTLDQDSRPNCLILDEIDGCTAETIRHLVKAIQATGKKAIKRPIIGICNNLFAPALRELRSIAFCIQLGPTNPENLTKRLQMICDRESLRCDATTLRRLCDLCANDMRQAINTLQWVAIAAKKNKGVIGTRLVEQVIEKERSGTSSIFENWSTVLELSRHACSKGNGVKSAAERAHRVQRVALDYGDERFVAGLHANYLVQMPIGVIRKAATWFQFYDDIHATVDKLQNYTLMRYQYAFYVALHFLVATHARLRLAFPHTEQNFYTKRKESIETVQAVIGGTSVPQRINRKELVVDVLPLLVKILQPPIKPMNEQLYTPKERAILTKVIDTMCSFNLTFSPVLLKDQMNYLFAPPIDVLTMFPLGNGERRLVLSNATRQLIAHKLSMMRVRLEEEPSPKVVTNTSKIKGLIEEANTAASSAAKKMKRMSAGAEKRLKHQDLGDVHYEFVAGDSYAVKKKITMANLLSLVFGSC